MMQNNMYSTHPHQKYPMPKKYKKTTGKKVLRICLRVLAMLLTAVLLFAAVVMVSLKMICSEISPAAQKMFVTTILETGQLKFMASLFLSPEEIQEIVNTNSMKEFNEEVDDTLIQIGASGNFEIGSGIDENTDLDPFH